MILHIDVNNAFLSWTAVKMLQDGAKIDIRKTYAVVAGNEKVRRGIVLAKSDLCKKIGIKTTETLYSARQKRPSLKVYQPDYNTYKLYSNLMYQLLTNYFERIERYSIDECFVDYSGFEKMYGDVLTFAYKLKEEIKNNLGFTVNIGIGNNKLLAKMASDFKKPDRVHTLYIKEIATKMWPLPVGDLFMVGKKSVLKLNEIGITTIGDLAHTNQDFLVLKFKKFGILLYEYANGIDKSTIEINKDDCKSISASVVLPHDTDNIDYIEDVFKKLVGDVGKKLRNYHYYCSLVGINIKYNDFTINSSQIKLANVTNKEQDILKNCFSLFHKLWNNEKIRSLGVRISNFSNINICQLSLFNNNIVDTDQLQIMIDEINRKYGKDIIKYANYK